MTQAEFKEIFDEHFDEIRNYIYYRSGDTALASDVAQETFIRLWEKQFDISTQKIRALLYKISNNLFISNYRKEQTAMNFRLQLKNEYSDQTPEDQMQFEDLNIKYNQALQLLPEKQRVVFLMSRMDELKYHEIADRLNLSKKAVEKRMSQALDFLRKALHD